MRIVPAVSVLDGVMVEVVSDGYGPLRNDNGAVISPKKLMLALKKKYGEAYILDIDGIEVNEPNLKLIQKITPLLPLWVDAGSRDIMGVMDILVAGIANAVISTKTMHELDFLEEAYEMSDNIVFCVDYADQIICPEEKLAAMGIGQLSADAARIGIRKAIFFDFNRMSGSGGLAVDKIKEMKDHFGEVFVAGIGAPEDIKELETIGIDGVIADFKMLKEWNIPGIQTPDEDDEEWLDYGAEDEEEDDFSGDDSGETAPAENDNTIEEVGEKDERY